MDVNDALGEPASAEQAGDAKKLQAACADLDEVTKPLAEMLMDRAVEAMLKKKGVL